MMSVMHGADADELDRLAAEFDRVADQLDRESGALSGLLNNISWLGDAAGRYVSDWTGFQMPKIGLSTRFLRDQASLLRRQAGEQRAASDGTSGSRRLSDTSSLRADAEDRERGARTGFDDGWIDAEQVIRGLDGFKDGLGGITDTAFFALGFIPFMGKLPTWLIGTDDWAALRLLGTSGIRKLPFGADLYRRSGGLTTALRRETWAKGMLKPLSSAQTWRGAGLSSVVGGIDVFLNQRQHGWGAAETIESEVDAGLTTLFSFVPGGAIAYGASKTATEFVYQRVDAAFDGRISDNGYRDYIQRAYGVTDPMDLTQNQLDEVNHRYSGWSGLYHATGDSVVAGIGDAAGAATSAGRWFKGLFD